MKIMTVENLVQEYAKAVNKPCMYISFFCEEEEQEKDADFCNDEFLKAAPYLNTWDHYQILVDGCGVLEFNSETEMDKYYNMTVGDDGPTHLNKHSGPGRVYAATYNANGVYLKENT